MTYGKNFTQDLFAFIDIACDEYADRHLSGKSVVRDEELQVTVDEAFDIEAMARRAYN